MPLKVHKDEQHTLNLTPMIDVVFLLIIFFMVATKFSEIERNIDLQLPQVANAGESTPPDRPKSIAVYADGTLKLDGTPITRSQLVSQLQVELQSTPDLEVELDGDANCPFQYVADALAACREANVVRIGISVELATAAASGDVLRK